MAALVTAEPPVVEMPATADQEPLVVSVSAPGTALFSKAAIPITASPTVVGVTAKAGPPVVPRLVTNPVCVVAAPRNPTTTPALATTVPDKVTVMVSPI